MNQEQDRREENQRHQREADQSRLKKKVSVVSYLAILFAAAFLLLLLSYFMQQRSSEAAISGLKDSMSSFQSVETLVDTNKRLQEENDSLTEQMDTLDKRVLALEKAQLENQTASAEQGRQLQAMDWFWRIQRAYSKGSRSDAKALIEQFESSGFSSSLPQVSSAVPDGPSPADQYEALLSALGFQSAEP